MKKAYLLLLAGMLSTAVFAGSKQTIKIDGQVIEKTVSEITFDGDNVVLQYNKWSPAAIACFGKYS